MTISFDPWKLFRFAMVALVLTAFSIGREAGPYMPVNPGGGCSMIHQE